LDGVNTYAWASKTGSSYQVNRDIDLTTLRVRNGVILFTAGYRVFANVSITVDSGGRIHNDGFDATLNVFGQAAPAGTLGSGSNGTGGVTNTSSNASINIGGLGGQGGQGGNADAGHTGATAGAVTAPIASRGSYRRYVQASLGHFLGNGGITPVLSGTGGTGGGSNNALATSGAGGGTGGVMVLASPLIVNNGTISCKGGNGGNATATAGSAGAGSGGGGGVIFLISPGFSGNTPSVAGGSPGVGAGSPTTSATAGSAGTLVMLT
jgi:hypothetical protein